MHMKIERSSSTRGDATITPGGLRRLVGSLFLVAAAVALVKVDAIGAVASPRANQGRSGVGNALPATTIVVTNTNDSGPGSLRNALAVANDGDTIDATGVSGTILLISGELQINHNVTINGPGAGSLAVNGNGTFRVFKIETSDAIISGFTITNGLAADGNGGGGILNLGGLTLSDSVVSDCSALSGNNPYGGAISTFAVGHGATLTVSNCTISGNSAEVGGAIESVALAFQNGASSVVTISNSTLSNNSATHYGGAIYNSATGLHSVASLSIANSTINGNGTGCEGGGIFNSNAQLTVTNSTISGNSTHSLGCAGNGGGIFYSGAGTVIVANSVISGNGTQGAGGGIGSDLPGGTIATVTDSTISSNSAGGYCEFCGEGGGIFNSGQILTVTNSTISGNTTHWQYGGSIRNVNGAAAQIGDTILNGGTGGTIINDGGTVTSLGYNLASDSGGGVLTGLGDQINTDPMLGPLQDNGGPTFTHALLPGSPAIDAGDPNFTPPPFYDQRGPGFARVANGRIDKGSFEVQGPIPQSAFSRKTHGAAGTFDVPLPLGGNVGIECRSGGSTNDYQMIINFMTNVTVESASVTSGTGMVTSLTGSGAPTITVNLTGVINIQRITMTLHNVNDGTRTGDVPVSMGVLIGDTTENGLINAGDVSQTKSQVGQAVTTSNFREDVNASGTITAADVAIVKSDVGTSLPP